MSEKNLSEAEWKKFKERRDYKDSALLKAFSELKRARTADDELDALDDVEKEAAALRKSYKDDKELKAYLDVLDKSLARDRAAAQRKRDAEAAADDEEESPALLTSKMLPLLRQVRKGEEMRVLLAVASKEVAVLVSRKAISTNRRKTLSNYLDAGTPKYFAGVCIYEQNAFTFVMRTQAAGLAKKVKAALLKQVEMRLKVRVRGEDPADIDDDGEVAEDMPEEGFEQAPVAPPMGAAPGAPGAKAAAPRAAATPAAAPTRTPTPEPAPAEPPAAAAAAPKAAAAAGADDPLKSQYESRLATLEPRVLALLRARTGDVGKLRAVVEFVRGKGDADQFKAALAGMDSLEKLVVEAEKSAPAAPEEKPQGPAARTAAFTARLTALMPAIKAVTGPDAAPIKARVAQAGALARAQDFDGAGQALGEIETLVARAQASTPADAAQDSTADAARRAVDDRLAAVESDYLDLLARNPADADRLRAVHGLAVSQAQAGDAAKAAATLDELARRMASAQAALAAGGDAAAASAGSYQGLVRYRKSLLDFRAAAATVDNQIAGLKKAIPSVLPGETALADELVEALGEYTAGLLEAVDTAMRTAENEASPVTSAVSSQLRRYLQELSANPLVKHLDGNPFGVAVSVERTLGAALEDIRDAMPAIA